jgi:hypothetical protein
VGDSAQSLLGNVSRADADVYLTDRQAHGFNAIWVQALSNDCTAGWPDRSTFTGSTRSRRPTISRSPAYPVRATR